MLATIVEQLVEKEVKLEVTDAAKDLLGDKGFDEVFGARPLRRTIQDRVTDILSEDLLRGRFRAGDTVIVDVDEGEIIVRPTAVGVLAGEDES